MKPVRTADTNLMLTAPEGVANVDNLPAQVLEDGAIASVWWLDDDERRAIAEQGANIVLVVLGPHPAVQMQVVIGQPSDAPEPLIRHEQMTKPEPAPDDPTVALSPADEVRKLVGTLTSVEVHAALFPILGRHAIPSEWQRRNRDAAKGIVAMIADRLVELAERAS